MRNSVAITEDNYQEMFARAGVTAPAQEPAKPAAGNNGSTGGTFDVQSFVKQHLGESTEEPYNGGRRWVLKVCPFNADHKGGSAAVIELPGGAIAFKCQHNGCAGLKWQDVREKFEPGCYDQKPREKQQNGKRQQTVDESTVKAITYERITAADLDKSVYRQEYIAEDFYLAAQPMIWAGGKKCLKTNGVCDAGISFVSGKPVFGKFTINRRIRVAIMTGESGMATIQETCRRICKAKDLELAKLDGLIFSPDLPRIDDVNHQEALRRWLKRDDIECLILDPAYLVVPAEDNGNLFAQGAMLRNLTEVCADVGVGIILCHHTRKNLVDPFAAPELEDIAWAGFQEFARQWVLVSRRQKYEPGTGHHELWLNVGGSAGHSSLWALNVDEGTPKDQGGRRWQVEMLSATEARQDAQEKQEAKKQEVRDTKHVAKVNAAKDAIAGALRSVPDNAETVSQIRQRSGCKGAAFDEAMGELLRIKKLIPFTVTRANKQTYEGYQYVFGKE